MRVLTPIAMASRAAVDDTVIAHPQVRSRRVAGLKLSCRLGTRSVIASITPAISPWRRCNVLSMLEVRGLKITG